MDGNIAPAHLRDLFHMRDKARKFSKIPTIVRLREGGLLVTKEPPMCVCSVDDIDISPLEWTGGRGNRGGGRQALVQASMCMVIAARFDRDSS